MKLRHNFDLTWYNFLPRIIADALGLLEPAVAPNTARVFVLLLMLTIFAWSGLP